MFFRTLFGSFVGLLSVAAGAADMRDYCPDRPGLGTPACTIDPGHGSVEVGMADWTLDRTATERTDTLLLGDVLIRYGISDHAEVQFGWTGFGRERVRDRLSGARSTDSGIDDVQLGLRRNLANPDGSAFSLAVMAFATLPVGREPIGAGDWGAGFLVPMSYDLDDRFSLELVPEIDAAVDSDGQGRHLAYSTVAGLEAKLDPQWTVTAEYQFVRDRDPEGHESRQLAGLSMAWQPRDDLQVDVGANGGLNHNAPDLQLYIGLSRRF